MMTMLVATLGLLPAALSHGIGFDSQRPLALVIVGGLVGAMVLSIFLLPTLYICMGCERYGSSADAGGGICRRQLNVDKYSGLKETSRHATDSVGHRLYFGGIGRVCADDC